MIHFRPFFYDWAHFTDTYQKQCSSESRILEVGASSLGRTSELARLCGELVGIDLDLKRIPTGAGIPPNVSYRVGDWEDLSSVVAPDTFDLVVASHVIEHVPNDLKAVNETYKVLKKGGVAMVSTPNILRVGRLFLDLVEGKREFPWWEHQREYSLESFSQLFERSEFTKFEVVPVAFGVHFNICTKPVFVALKGCPPILGNYACSLEAVLWK